MDASSGREGVCVFSPTPFFTVTVERGGEGPSVHFHAGSQGFWVASMVTALGMPTTLCGAFGGESGPVLRTLIEAANVRVRAIECSRANGGYVQDRRDGELREIVHVKTGDLSRHEIDDLYDATLTCGLSSRAVVLTGPTPNSVVPGDVYRRLARDLDAHGVPVVADVSGSTLAAFDGGVTMLKVSHEELLAAGIATSERVEELVRAMRDLACRGIRNVVVSRAAAPALALIDGGVVEITSPRFEPREHRGAGDSMTAALACGVASGMEPDAMLRLAAAAGALNVTRHGLGTGRRDDIEHVAQRVQVKPLSV